MTGAAQTWACGKCRSINSARAGRCYSCHTPREVAAVDPLAMPTVGPATLNEPVKPETYRSSESRAVLLTIATVVYLLAGTVTFLFLRGVAFTEGTTDPGDEIVSRLPLLFVPTAVGFLALAAFGAWISRVIENLPALGAGYSRVSPTYAFVEPLIPGINLYAVPARIAEVAEKLEGTGRAQLLVVLAWVALVGPAVVLGIWLRWVGAGSDDFWPTLAIASIGKLAFQAIGLALGLAAVWHVESLCRKRGDALPAREPATPG